ncbi:MAG: zf-TFIIB domain-containing protein [Candidatus Xenobia bacterium]
MSEKTVCPNCAGDTALKLVVDPDTHAGVYSCDFCDGLWFPGLTLRKFLCCRLLMKRFLTAPPEAEGFKEFNVDTANLSCGRCQATLQPAVYARVEFFQCLKCQGLWFGEGALARVLKRYPSTGEQCDVLAREMDHARRVLNASQAAAAAMQAEHESGPRSFVDFKAAAQDPETLTNALKDTALEAANKGVQKAAELGNRTADKLGDAVTGVVKFLGKFRR